MSGRIERNGGWVDITGWDLGTTCKILSFAGRRALGGPRWHVSCNVCGSNWIDGHFAITESGKNYRCKNVACGDLHRIRPSKPVIEHDEKPKAMEFKKRVDVDYERYARYCRVNGFEPESQALWSQLDDRLKDDLLEPVATQELSEELERLEQKRLKETYNV